MSDDDIKENILSPSQWLRILYMVFFAVVCWLLGIIMSVLVIAQVLISLISGRDNENLRQLGASLIQYFYQILQFLTYNTEKKPFPFSSFPEIEDSPVEVDPAGDEDFRTRTAPASDNADVFADMSFTEEKPATSESGQESARSASTDDVQSSSGEQEEPKPGKPEG